MTAVMIGVDPAKRSHAMAVLDSNENELAALQVGNDNDGYRDMVDSTGGSNTSIVEVLMGRPAGWMKELTG